MPREDEPEMGLWRKPPPPPPRYELHGADISGPALFGFLIAGAWVLFVISPDLVEATLKAVAHWRHILEGAS